MSWIKQHILSLAPLFWTTVRSALQINKQDAWYGLRIVVVILAPLLVAGVLARLPDFSDSANFLVLGALFTALVAPDGTYGRRARRIGVGACLEASACILGTLLGNLPFLALLLLVFWAFGAGMLTTFGKVGATLDYVAVACFVISLADPASPGHIWLRCVILLSGALWALVVMVWDWPLRRYQPFRVAVTAYYHTLRALLTPLSLSLSGSARGREQREADFWALQTKVQNMRKEAHLICDERPRDPSPTFHRQVLFLEKADALFDVQISLAMSLRTISFQTYPARVQETLARGIAVAEKALVGLAEALRRGKLSDKEHEIAKALQEEAENLAVACTFPLQRETDVLALAHLQHVLHLYERLVTLCQEGLALMEDAIPDLSPIVQTQPRKEPHAILVDVWQTLSMHLTTRSYILRYALRLSIAVSLATALSLLLRIPHGYWMPMSVAILLKPDFRATRQRIWQRLGGTIVGGLLAGALSLVLFEQGLLLLLMTLCCFLAFLARPRQYGIYAFFLTAFLVFSTDIGHLGNWAVALVRVASNLVGAALAFLVVSLLWPQWEHEKLSDQMSRTVFAIRRFFQAVMNRYLVPSRASSDMKKARQLATLECLRATALVERLSHEPQSNQNDLARYATRLVSLQRICESLTALAVSITLDMQYDPLPGLSFLVEQMEQALQESEDITLCERLATTLLQIEESLLAVQETLRVVAMKRHGVCSSCSPERFQEDLLGMYTPLSIHLPSLVRHTKELTAATCVNGPINMHHP